MKKFFTIIPLQMSGQLDAYHYEPVGNSRLELEESKISFPILTALNGYVQAGEEVRIIAVASDVEATVENRRIFEEQLSALRERKGFLLPNGVEYILNPDDERTAAHAALFQKLIGYAEDGDELFACMTYGTKPMSMVLTMAVQYAYRVKENASISCVVYGAVNRKIQSAKVYDVTALLQMDELVRVLAEARVPDPKQVIDRMLSL